MKFLKIILHDKNGVSRNIVISDPDRIPKPLETKTITLTIDEIPINNSDIDSISIYPTDGKNYGLESKEPQSSIMRDSSGTRLLNAPPETVSWWRFDRTANDDIGNHCGKLQANATITENGELLLSDNGDYVDAGHSDDFDMKDSDFTISAWIKPENLLSSQYIVSKRNIANFADGPYAIFLYNNNFRAFLFDGFPKKCT